MLTFGTRKLKLGARLELVNEEDRDESGATLNNVTLANYESKVFGHYKSPQHDSLLGSLQLPTARDSFLRGPSAIALFVTNLKA